MKGKLAAALLFVVMLLVLVACGDEGEERVSLSLNDLSPVKCSHVSGFELSLPSAWQETSRDDYTVSFADEESKISMVASLEIGGMSYFSNAELGDLAADIGLSVLSDGAIRESGEYGRLAAAGYACVYGKSGDKGINTVCETVILQHIPAVRCYISVITDTDSYMAYEDVFDDIFASLKVTKPEDDLYSELDDMAEAYKQELELRETDEKTTE